MTSPSATATRPGCPELEVLAAFVDGRLAGAERARLVAHLADCDACRELVAEAQALVAEASASGATATSGEVVPFRRPRRAPGRRRALVAAAAALALAVAGVVWLRSPSPVSSSTMAALGGDPQAFARLPAGWDEPLWPVTRGDEAEISQGARAFRLGARSATLELALAAGDRRAARRLAAESARLLADVSLAEPIARFYRELDARAAEPDLSLAELADDAASAARLASVAVGAPLWQLGRWSETGRLATTAGARVGLPRLPPLPASLPGEIAELARRADRPELDASPATRAAAFAELVARGGDLR